MLGFRVGVKQYLACNFSFNFFFIKNIYIKNFDFLSL